MKYVVGTVSFPFKTYPCKNITEARKKSKELRKQGIKTEIILITENGNDYIISE